MPKSSSHNSVLCKQAILDTILKIPRFNDRWIINELLFQAMLDSFHELKTIGIDRSQMVRLLSNKVGPNLWNLDPNANPSGIFGREFTGDCPITEKRRRLHYYYVTAPGGAPPDQASNS
jgi:hypothetical protein